MYIYIDATIYIYTYIYIYVYTHICIYLEIWYVYMAHFESAVAIMDPCSGFMGWARLVPR